MTMTPALIAAMLERDRAARTVDPKLLTESEKDAAILAQQARNEELESIAEFLATLIVSIERETLGAGANDREYRKRILLLCADLKRCAIPVTRIERVTGTETFVGRAW